MPDKLLELKNDLVFQKIFGMQKNSHITGHLLSLILEKEIYNVDLDVNKRMLKSRSNSKTNRLDIRAKFNNGEDCNIEMQVIPYQFMPERMLDYWSGMYDSKINSGQDYEILKPSISILIADYNLEQLKDIEKYHTTWNLREKDFSEKIITNNIELHILEIHKIKNNEILKDELAYLSDDPDFQLLVDSRAGMLRDIYSFQKQCKREAKEAIEEGIKEAKEEGKKEGKEENKKEIAKKLLDLEIPIDKIIIATGLTKEEIEKL